jgi:phosphohistidine phosphatase SixA
MVVFVLRHADKSGPTSDALSAAGQARARLLARMLGECGVTRIYHTEFQRSRQTAKPLRDKLGNAAKTVQIELGTLTGEQHAAKVVAALRAGDDGGVAVVIGHSDTVAPVVSGLGGVATITIEEHEFDQLIIVSTAAQGPATVIPLRYGDASTPA